MDVERNSSRISISPSSPEHTSQSICSHPNQTKCEQHNRLDSSRRLPFRDSFCDHRGWLHSFITQVWYAVMCVHSFVSFLNSPANQLAPKMFLWSMCTNFCPCNSRKYRMKRNCKTSIRTNTLQTLSPFIRKLRHVVVTGEV